MSVKREKLSAKGKALSPKCEALTDNRTNSLNTGYLTLNTNSPYALRSAWSVVSSSRHALCALRGECGVALVEVLVAGVVLGIAIVGLAVMFSWGQAFVVAQGDDRVALYLAQQKIESLRASSYSAAEALNSNCGGTPEADENLTAGVGNSQSFIRQTAVELVNDDDLTTPECGTNTIHINVTVTANTRNGDVSVNGAIDNEIVEKRGDRTTASYRIDGGNATLNITNGPGAIHINPDVIAVFDGDS